MRPFLLGLIVLWATAASAGEAQLSLFEEASGRTDHYALQLENGVSTRTSESMGSPLAVTSNYRVSRSYKLEAVVSGTPIMDATEILAEGHVGGIDIVVVRDEHNSLSNPFRWLALVSGHPIQVSRIVWVVIKKGVVVHQSELRREPSSYRWRASLFEPPEVAPAQ